jgi:hypothetical protein
LRATFTIGPTMNTEPRRRKTSAAAFVFRGTAQFFASKGIRMSQTIRWLGSAVALVCGLSCGVAPEAALHSRAALCGVAIDPSRSLLVTDATTLNQFGFERTMNQLFFTGSVSDPEQFTLSLFQEWWDSYNTASGAVTMARHCNDANSNTNGFPVQCPRAEGQLASANPFVAGPNHFSPIAVVNRFDLAPSTGTTCGEYRVVYARDSGRQGNDRTFIIFEAALPNPQPALGIEGCRPVAEFWASLSSDEDATSRAAKLATFYYSGLPGFQPVIHASHYGMGASSGGYVGGSNAGQIRTNQFASSPWLLREFKLRRPCIDVPADGVNLLASSLLGDEDPDVRIGGTVKQCRLRFDQVTVKANPFAPLFGNAQAASANFQTEFVANLGSLLATDPNGIALNNSNVFNATDSNSQSIEHDYQFQGASNASLRSRVTAVLPPGSPLSFENVLAP